MQETTFPVEILIHDDASTDGTDDIIREYTEKYPDMIFPLFEKENQYSKPKHKQMDLYNYERAKGKYIAYCEGDDFWTDPLKLQKQVDFMETHPDYSVCWHRRSIVDAHGNFIKDEENHPEMPQEIAGIDITLETVFTSRFVQPLTMMFRQTALDIDNMKRFKHYRDTMENYFLLTKGKGYVMSFNGGCYRVHSGGVSSSISRYKYCEVSLPVDREFYWKTKVKGAKRNYMDTLEVCVQQYAGCKKWKAFLCAVEYFIVTGHSRSLVRHGKTIFYSGRK